MPVPQAVPQAQARKLLAAEDEARDPRVEAELDALHIERSLVMNVPVGSFDVDGSLANQVRMGKPLDKPTVTRYIEALRAGDRFPPVVAQRQADGSYVALDGNHRLSAHREVGRALNVYVVEAPAAVLVRFSFEANAKHGLPASEDDRLHHALYLVDNGMSIKEAARRFQLPHSRLQVASLAIQAGRRADDIGIPRGHLAKLPRTSLARLQGIRTDEGFAAAVQLVVDAGIKAPEMERLLRDLSEVRGSASKQLAVVNRWREDLRPRIGTIDAGGAGRRNPFASPKSRLRQGISALAPLTDPAAMDEVPPIERPDLAKEVRVTIERLQAIAARLEAK